MAIENIRDWIQQIGTATDAQKLTIAELLRDIETQLREADGVQTKTDSDARRAAAITFIATTIEPQLITPTGNFTSQHTQILSNLDFLKTSISNAIDRETKDELNKRLITELDKFKQLRKDRAGGIIS